MVRRPTPAGALLAQCGEELIQASPKQVLRVPILGEVSEELDENVAADARRKGQPAANFEMPDSTPVAPSFAIRKLPFAPQRDEERPRR